MGDGLPWWARPSEGPDLAAASIPRLLHERLEETGVDFSVLYPTTGLRLPAIPDEELRRVAARAYNRYVADRYRDYADRLTPAAAIPLHTPQEGIDELEYAVNILGLKTAMIPAHIRRPIDAIHKKHPELYRFVSRLDHLGIDSDYDYDPFWAKCIELGVAPACHSGGMQMGTQTSPTNYMYNHIGHFAAAAEGLCKALVFGGVTRRFPALRVAFLECGVGWGCTTYSDIIARWEKRGRPAIQHLDPMRLDADEFGRLAAEYGDERIRAKASEIRNRAERSKAAPFFQDDFEACQVREAEDFKELYEQHFYFGCEADDPSTAWAFDTRVNPFGARIRTVLSSDIGHWDVPDIREVLEEAYELVERGLLTEEDFRHFAFTHPVELYAGMNPDFFKGTVCEGDVEKLKKELSLA